MSEAINREDVYTLGCTWSKISQEEGELVHWLLLSSIPAIVMDEIKESDAASLTIIHLLSDYSDCMFWDAVSFLFMTGNDSMGK